MSRNLVDLETNALRHWPKDLSNIEKESSVIPLLLETQDKFISLLKIADKHPFAWKDALNVSSDFSPNLFLKHLVVLADFGGEMLKRIKKDVKNNFGDSLKFIWKGEVFEYNFQTTQEKGLWSNSSLKLDGANISKDALLTDEMEDVINLVLFGASAIEGEIPTSIESNCIIGSLIGKSDELEAFIRQRYIWVSRITGGATANSLGYLAQNYVMEYLIEKLPNWTFNKKKIPGISHNERTPMAFDIVAESPEKKYCGIEASFQVTTNSTIERKAGQAKERQALMHENGHKIAYVIDGAGNFERASALKTICDYSDCTVTYSKEELDKLVEFLKSMNF